MTYDIVGSFLVGLFYYIISIVALCLIIAVFVWLHNISLNIWKIYTMMQEWDYDRKEKLEKEVK